MKVTEIRTVDDESYANELLVGGWFLFNVVSVGFVPTGSARETIEHQTGLRYVMVRYE